MDDREREIEEEVVAWFSEQAIDAQVCSAEDLDMMIDAVETELALVQQDPTRAERSEHSSE